MQFALYGSDCADCGVRQPFMPAENLLCSNTCSSANNGYCDDWDNEAECPWGCATPARSRIESRARPLLTTPSGLRQDGLR